MPMNGVSDIDLALAVEKSGGFPSITVFNYYQNETLNFKNLDIDLAKYCQAVGHSDILISMNWGDFLNPKMSELFIKYDIKFVELLIRPAIDKLWVTVSKTISDFKKNDVKFLFKTTKILPVCEYDAVILKGPNGAGRSFTYTEDLKTTFHRLAKDIGSDKIIPSGGIGNYYDARYFLNNGAQAIGVGTLIAASHESKVSIETKKRILDSTSKDIVNIGSLNCRGILFSLLDDDDDNNTKSLRAGIKGTKSGCIYVGNGIDFIHEILPVKTIIERLIYNVN
jgi:hypothetical protein